jgi:hypothetical protein
MIDIAYYYILVLEDGSEVEIFDWQDIGRKVYASKINHILMGTDNPFHEFVPEKYWDVTYEGETMITAENSAKLLTELLDRGLQSASIMTVATSMLIAKYILKETQSGQ